MTLKSIGNMRQEFQEIIHSAIILEKTNLFRANELLKAAKNLNPDSSFIEQKLKNYQQRLAEEPWELSRKGAQISEKNKIIFIHIPKCGGTSVNKSALFASHRGGHNTYDQIKLLLSKREFYKYKAFTIVRNPWDRLASAFHYLNRSTIETDLAVRVDYLERYEGCLKHFLEDFCTKPDFFLHLKLFKPMNQFINPRTSEIPLFVQKMEELEDITNLCKFLNIDLRLEKLNAALYCVNRKPGSSSYTEKTFKEVSAIFKEDIQIFDYQNYRLSDLCY